MKNLKQLREASGYLVKGEVDVASIRQLQDIAIKMNKQAWQDINHFIQTLKGQINKFGYTITVPEYLEDEFGEEVSLLYANSEPVNVEVKITWKTLPTQVSADMYKGNKLSTNAKVSFRNLPVEEREFYESWKNVRDSLMESIQTVLKEEKESDNEYQKYVRSIMKKKGIENIADLDKDEKKAFFDEIDAGWNSEDEAGKDGKIDEAFLDKFKDSIEKAIANLAFANNLQKALDFVDKIDFKDYMAISQALIDDKPQKALTLIKQNK